MICATSSKRSMLRVEPTPRSERLLRRTSSFSPASVSKCATACDLLTRVGLRSLAILRLTSRNPAWSTLEPVDSRFRGTFAVELWPGGDLPASDGGTLDALADDVIEPVENGTIDVGRVVLERLADLIDPIHAVLEPLFPGLIRRLHPRDRIIHSPN